MADFNDSEILTEVSKIFRASLEPGREGGTLNTQVEYQQLLEMASTTFLLNNDAIFYLGRIVANRLQFLVSREVAFIEDMLVALDDLGQIGTAVEDTVTLSNAQTALLSLDAAGTVQNRPETDRFTNLMDTFAGQLRNNVVSRRTNALVRPREDARNVLRTDLTRLQSIHNRVLTAVFALRDLLDNFNDLDIPSKAAATAFSRIRDNLEGLQSDIETQSATNNIATSRSKLLTTLSSKAAVNVVALFTDPRELKFRSPPNPIPFSVTHFGQVTGDGDPASVLTSAGPWAIPISDPISLSVNGGGSQAIDVDEAVGSVINGRAEETFEITAGVRQLSVILDPEVKSSTITVADTTQPEISDLQGLGYKHLGGSVVFPDSSTANSTDFFPRVLTEISGNLQTATVTSVTPQPGDLYEVTANLAAGLEAAGLLSHHIGGYLRIGTDRWEIIEISSAGPTPAIFTVAVPAGVTAPSVAGGFIHSWSPSVASQEITIAPALMANLIGDRVEIGPVVKNAQLPLGAAETVADLVTAIEAEASGLNAVAAPGVNLHRHVRAEPVKNDPTRISLAARTAQDPYIQIASAILNVQSPTADAPIVEDSAHVTLGFNEGELDTTNILTPAELAAAINESGVAVTGEVVTTDLLEGASLKTLQNTKDVEDTSVDFLAAGVGVGDQIEVRGGGIIAGTFQITVVTANTLTLDRPDDFLTTEPNLTYSIFREQVRISTVKTDRGSSLEVLSGPPEFDLPSGVQYGSITQFEAADRLGNLLSFDGVVAGDLLRLVGSQELFTVAENLGTTLVLEQGLPSNIESRGFEIRSTASREYTELEATLQTFTTSRNLLGRNNYDENLDFVDVSLTTALLPGQNFASSRNQARRALTDLLEILTSNPQRTAEYTATVSPVAFPLEDILAEFAVAPVPAVDSLLDAFTERKYDRAVRLLQSGQITEFYDTDQTTGSFGGVVLSNSRAVNNDLPVVASDQLQVENEVNVAVGKVEDLLDPNFDFDDIEEQDPYLLE